MMRAGLERHIEIRAPRAPACRPQRDDLGVRQPGSLVMPAREDAPFAHHQGTHRRVGMRPAAAPRSLEQRQPHQLFGRIHFFCALRSEMSSFSSLMNSPRSLKER